MNHWQDHLHLTNENHIKRRIHMQDQVDANKTEELMHHYDHSSPHGHVDYEICPDRRFFNAGGVCKLVMSG